MELIVFLGSSDLAGENEQIAVLNKFPQKAPVLSSAAKARKKLWTSILVFIDLYEVQSSIRVNSEPLQIL